jgi:hypothetical protein
MRCMPVPSDRRKQSLVHNEQMTNAGRMIESPAACRHHFAGEGVVDKSCATSQQGKFEA